MIIEVDPESPVPAYEQLRGQLADMIGAGVLSVGHRLPPIRQLAADLSLAPGTVARVYRELESDGLVHSRRRHGTTVAGPVLASAASVRASAQDAGRSYVMAMRRLGLGLEESLDVARAVWGELEDARA